MIYCNVLLYFVLNIKPFKIFYYVTWQLRDWSLPVVKKIKASFLSQRMSGQLNIINRFYIKDLLPVFWFLLYVKIFMTNLAGIISLTAWRSVLGGPFNSEFFF